MFINYCNVTIEGRATKDAEKRFTKTGKKVCNFTLAVNHYSKDESDPKVSYVDVETWDKFADICGDHVTKGKWIMVFGELRQERWLGDDGKGRSKFKVIANEIRYLTSSVPAGNHAKEVDCETTIAV